MKFILKNKNEKITKFILVQLVNFVLYKKYINDKLIC